jgi:hypothetical protein
MNIIELDKIKQDAQRAANENKGSHANPYPEGSAAANYWIHEYYKQVEANAIQTTD